MISEDLPNAISSPESEDGPTLFTWRESIQMFRESGRDPAPVSPSQPRGNKKGEPTIDISGRNGFASSGSRSLQSFLESRLQARFGTDGSIWWHQTWNPKVTQSGRRYLEHTPSAHLTSGNDCGFWHTPRVTEIVEDPKKSSQRLRDRKETTCTNLTSQAIYLFPWAIPRANDAEKRGNIGSDPKNGLPGQVTGIWATPSARDWKDTPGMARESRNPDGSLRKRLDQLSRQIGLISNGSGAGTEKRGRLNPAFSRWLMGYPKEWCEAAIRAKRLMPTTARRREKKD